MITLDFRTRSEDSFVGFGVGRYQKLELKPRFEKQGGKRGENAKFAD